MTTYRKRENLFEKAEREWRVDPHALVLRTAEGNEMAYAWRDVVTVRLRYAPTRFKTWRYVFDVAFKNGVDWSIDNVHFAGIASFEDRSAAYTPFVHAALARIKAEAPAAKVYAGATPLSYYGQSAFVLAAFALLAAVLLTLPILDGIPGVAVVKLLIIAAMLPFLIKWLRTSYPRAIAIDAIPENALPPAGG